MTVDIVFNVGEEYAIDQNPDGNTHTYLLYDDSTDSLGESDNLSAIGTEPGNSNYSRQSDTVTTEQLSGDYGWNNDNSISFDFSDVSSNNGTTVDAIGEIADFDSTVAGNSGSQLISNGALSKSYDTANIDSIDFASASIQVTGN